MPNTRALFNTGTRELENGVATDRHHDDDDDAYGRHPGCFLGNISLDAAMNLPNRQDCFRNSVFTRCVDALLLSHEAKKFDEMVDELYGK